MKEHDWVGESLSNPTFTNSDFKSVGITAQNTSIGPESVYTKIDTIRNNPEFQTNGSFDQTKFHKKYEELLVSYNKLANDTYQEDLLNQGRIFDYNNIFAPPEERKLGPQTFMTMEPNPDHISKGLTGFNRPGPRTMTPMERAEGQKIFDPATGQFTDDTPEDSFFKNIFKPIVMATWDFNADANGNPTDDPAQIVYQKGQYKLNPDGEYYTEFLNGRSPYDKQIISKWDILTPEGSVLNNFDMFDSDDIEKSTGGSIMRNALKIAPFFIPEVAPFYAAASLGLNLTDALGTLGKLVLGSENNSLNTLTAFTSQFNQTTSEFGQQHTFSLENILNMIGDTFTFLKSQRVLAEYAPRMFMDKVPKNDDEFKERATDIAKAWESNRRRLLQEEMDRAVALGDQTGMSRIIGQLQSPELAEAAQLYANKTLQNQIAAFQKLGQQISTGTMAVTFGLHTYGHAKAQGVSDTAATALTLGAIAGQYAILSSHIGQHIFPEAQINNKRLEKAIDKIFTPTKGNGETLAQASKKVKAVDAQGKVIERHAETLNFMQKGWNLAKEMWKVQSTPTRATMATTAAQAVEMTTFTALDDVIASVYNLSQYVSGSDHRMSAWDDILGRYGSSLIGGAVAGAIGAKDIYKSAKALREMTNESAFHTIIYMINEDKIDTLFKAIDNLELGNKYLSGTKQYSITENGEEKLYWDMGTKEDNQDVLNKQILKETILKIRDILQSQGAKISRDSLLGKLIDGKTLINDFRLNSLLQANVTIGYLQEFINNQYKMVKSGLLLSKDPAIRRQLGITDPMVRETRDEVKEAKKIEAEGGDAIKSDAVSPEAKFFINAERTLKECVDFNNRFVTGDISKDFIPDAIFELIPGLHFFLTGEGFRIFVREEKQVNDISKLSKQTLESYRKEYENIIFGQGHRDKIYFMRHLFDAFNESMQPVLKKRLIERSEIAENFLSLFRITQGKQSRSLQTDLEVGNFQQSNLWHKGKFGVIVNHLLGGKRQIIDGSELEKLGAAILKIQEQLTKYKEGIGKVRTQFAQEGRLYTQDTLFGETHDGLEVPEFISKTYQRLKSGMYDELFRDDISRFLTAMMTEEGINSLLKQLENLYRGNLGKILIPKLEEFITEHKNEFGYVDYTTRLELMNFIKSLDSDVMTRQQPLESIRYPNGNVREDGTPEYSQMGLDSIFYEEVMPIGELGEDIKTIVKGLNTYEDLRGTQGSRSIDKLAQLLGIGESGQETKVNILNIDDWQILSTLDETIKKIDKDDSFSISDVMSAVEQQYLDLEEKVPFYDQPRIDLSRFILDPNSVTKLQRIIQLSEVLKSTLIAAEEELESRYDMFGYNATLNTLLKLEGDQKLATIDANEVQQRILSVDKVQLRIRELLAISNLAQSQKWGNSQKIDMQFQAFAFDKIYQLFFQKINNGTTDVLTDLENHEFDDGTKFKGVQQLRDALNNAVLLQAIAASPIDSPTAKDKHNARVEFFNVLEALHDFYQANMDIVNTPSKLSYLINKDRLPNYGDNLFKYKSITQHEAPDDPIAVLSLMASIASVRPSVFWSNLAKDYPQNRLPVEVQHVMAYEQFAHMNDINGIRRKFAEAYNESLKDGYDTNTSEGLIQYISEALSGTEALKFTNTLFTEAGPGFGKSGGVTPLALHMLIKLAKDRAKNLWIYKPSKPVQDIVEKIGLTKEQLEELNISTFEFGEKGIGKLEFMGKMFTNYKQPIIDGETMKMKVDTGKQYRFDLETLGIESETEVKVLPEANKPKVIIIDEFTDMSEGEWIDLNRFAKANNIQLIALGDFLQSGLKATEELSITYDGKSLGGGDWALHLIRGNTLHTFAGQFSLRSDNLQIDSDLATLKAGRIAFLDEDNEYNMVLHNYFSPTEGLFGTYVEDAWYNKSIAIDLSKDAKDRIDAIFNDVIKNSTEDERIKVVYVVSRKFTEGEQSPMYKYLSTKKTEDGKSYWDYVTLQYDVTVKGEEAAYYIIDQDYSGIDRDIVASEWYTGLTRARKGSIFVDRISHNNNFKFTSETQTQTRRLTIPPKIMEENTKEYLESLNKIFEEAIPYEAPTAEETPPGAPEGPSGGSDGGPSGGPAGTPEGPMGDAENPPIVESDPESGVEGVTLGMQDTPETTVDGTGQAEDNASQAANDATPEENSAMNTIAATASYDEIERGDPPSIKNARLQYGIYPFRAQRTGYTVEDPSSRDGLKADGYSPFKDDRSDCVYGLRRIQKYIAKLNGDTYEDIYDLEGKSDEQKQETVSKVVNLLQNLTNVVFSAKSDRAIIEQFIKLLGLSEVVDPKDLYVREAIIKRNPRGYQYSVEKGAFRSLAVDFEHELEYGANGTYTGTEPSAKNNAIARAEYSLIFGVKDSKYNAHDGSILLTLPLAGLPNWKTIIQNKMFAEEFRNRLQKIINTGKSEPEQAFDFLDVIDEIVARRSASNTLVSQALMLKAIVDTYVNVSTTVTFLPNKGVPISSRYKIAGPYVINNNRGVTVDGKGLHVDGMELNAAGMFTNVEDIANKPQWHVSSLYAPRIYDGPNDCKYYKDKKSSTMLFKAGSPYVFVTAGDRIPGSVDLGDLHLTAGNMWTDEAMIQYYMKSLDDPSLDKWVKKISVSSPAVTVDEFLDAMRHAIYANKEDKEQIRLNQDIGNMFTAYRIVQKLYQKYWNRPDSEPKSAFRRVCESNQSRLLRRLNAMMTWDEDAGGIKAKLDAMHDIEVKYKKDNEYVGKIIDELRAFHTARYITQDGVVQEMQVRWHAVFNMFLYELTHPTVLSRFSKKSTDEITPLMEDLYKEIRDVTKAWASETGGSDNVIHYNVYLDRNESTAIYRSGDITIDFRRITNVDDYRKDRPSYKMHGKPFTFPGVLVSGPATGDIMYIFQNVRRSLTEKAEMPDETTGKLSPQRNSKNTAVYDKASTEGGSAEEASWASETDFIEVWDLDRKNSIVVDKKYESEIESIVSQVRNSTDPRKTSKKDPITGANRDVQIVDEKLREAGFFTYWDNSQENTRIYITKPSAEELQELDGYKLVSIKQNPFYYNQIDSKSQRDQLKRVLQKISEQNPNNRGLSVDEAIARLKDDIKKDGITDDQKVVVLALKKGNEPTLFVRALRNTKTNEFELKMPSENSKIVISDLDKFVKDLGYALEDRGEDLDVDTIRTEATREYTLDELIESLHQSDVDEGNLRDALSVDLKYKDTKGLCTINIKFIKT